MKRDDVQAHMLAAPLMAPSPRIRSVGDRLSWRAWTTGEEMTLREVYPTLGAQGMQALLPYRSLSSIRARAAKLKVPAPNNSRKGRPRTQHHASEELDQLLRERLPACTLPGMLERLSVEVQRPTWWLLKRGRALCIDYGLRKSPRWSPEEDAVLREWCHLTLYTVKRKLSAQLGSVRTMPAIANRLKVLKLSRVNADVYSANDAATLLGFASGKALSRHIESGALKAYRTPGSKASTPEWCITRRALRDWIAAHPALVDLKRVDRFWFIDLAFGKPIGKDDT